MYIFVCPVFLCLLSRWLKASRVDGNKSSFGDHTTSTKVYTYKGAELHIIPSAQRRPSSVSNLPTAVGVARITILFLISLPFFHSLRIDGLGDIVIRTGYSVAGEGNLEPEVMEVDG